ncbi:prepilin-type N-terminal cleavage/methylation domain-containing protein [bacterium]|nr:prepilin-type N-terminal cleavage/methylation domain-containing protein [bacterium]MBU1882675.1 prepilin-type N-terminal cleavage/methylation domain-containing protein [bacterium]
MKLRNAFTMIELVFVIVVIGIIAKFGVEFLIKAYDGYIFSSVQNRLQTQTEIALEQITNRLQYRIKSSVIVRDNNDTNMSTNFRSLSNAQDNGVETILEWVGYDIDGQRGDWNGSMNIPTWSGFIDLDSNDNNSSTLKSSATDTTNINTLITNLSNNAAGINDSAIFFIGANSDINGYGWGGQITDQNQTMHPIQSSTAVDLFASNTGANDFSGQDVYEFYQLAWTAYALVYTGSNKSNATSYINRLDDGTANPATLFDTNGSIKILQTTITSGTKNGYWRKLANNIYAVRVRNTDVNFTYDPTDGSFDCVVSATTSGEICRRLRN